MRPEKMTESVAPTKTLGELRVRTDFNPSEQGVVDQIKQKTAELINLVASVETCRPSEQSRLVSLSQTAYEEAAMWAVKAATL